MLAIERQNRILAYLQANQTALVSDLSREYHVTEETIRRDLEKLERRGLIRKTYGGAIYGQELEPELSVRSLDVRSEQENIIDIAKKAVELIKDGDTLMLDSSPFAIATARLLKAKNDITIVTNSLEIMVNCAYHRHVKVISTGGVVRPNELVLTGAASEQTLRALHVEKAIISCTAIHRDFGLSEENEQEAEVKRLMTRAARQIILGVENYKFDNVSFVQFLDVPHVHVIVTNDMPNLPWRDFLRQHQINLVA
ncbi:MAG: DeoR/GlpR family DNA-binding transcription regulator [Clostridiales bacterium]|nr:DeoR/GlpR family DNA-binding transcription regulator [Clostridiales bacterium]